MDVPVSKPNYASFFWRKLKDHRQNRGLGGAEMVKPRYHPVPWSFVSFVSRQKKVKQKQFPNRTLRYASAAAENYSGCIRDETPHYFFIQKVAKNLRDGFYTLRFTPKAWPFQWSFGFFMVTLRSFPSVRSCPSLSSSLLLVKQSLIKNINCWNQNILALLLGAVPELVRLRIATADKRRAA